jgi:glucose/galactose transporter
MVMTNSAPGLRPLILVGGFFFLFGFITWVNGSLIPYLTIACELRPWQAYLVTFSFYISYTLMAFPSSRLLSRTGLIGGMRAGLLTMTIGCLVFIPAAITRQYGLFLTGLFIVGTGLTLLQTAVNPYITVLGPMEKAAQRISIMGICNKFAGMLAPLIFGAVLLKNADNILSELAGMMPPARQARLDQLAKSVIKPYGILSAVLLILAAGIKFAGLPEIGSSESGDIEEHTKDGDKNAQIWAGFLAIFAAVGAEVIAGDTIANYGLYNGIPLGTAKHLTSFTLGAMMTGYFVGAFTIPARLSQRRAFFYSCLAGILVTLLILATSGCVSVSLVALLGLANALLWPAIWPQALAGLSGRQLHRASAILITGIAGGALMPLCYGWASMILDPRQAYVVLLPCYLYNLYYWKKGKRKITSNT